MLTKTFIIFFIPILISRFFITSKKNGHLFFSFIFGFIQDIALTFQKIFIFIFFSSNFTGTIFAFFILLFIDFFSILDSFLFSKLKIKMRFYFLVYFKDIRSFIDSIKAFSLKTFILYSSFLVLYNISAFCFINYFSFKFLLNTPLYYINLVLLFSSFFIRLFLKKKNIYSSSNAFLDEELNGIIKLFFYTKSFFTKKQLKQCNFDNENYYKLSTEYPLLRYTKNFKGEKLFDIKINKNEKPNIIFLMMESFRSKDVGCFNGKYNVTPNFDKLAKEGVLFKNFYSDGCFTNKALFSSLFGISSPQSEYRLKSYKYFPLIGVNRILKDQGYHTSYISNDFLSFDGLHYFFEAKNFDTIISSKEIKKKYEDANFFSWGIHDEYLMRYSIDFMKENKNTPLFLSMVTISNHHPWPQITGFEKKFPSNFNDSYKKYLNTFYYSDYALGLFVKKLRENKLNENTILFIFGDHGQNINENHSISYDVMLQEQQIHVPLLILADNRVKNTIIDDISSQIDLIPTLQDILNISTINHNMGRSLVRQTPNPTCYFHDHTLYDKFGLRNGKYKYIYNKTVNYEELYDLTRDREEEVNIANEYPKISKKFNSQILDFFNFSKSLFNIEKFTCKDSNSSIMNINPEKDISDNLLISIFKKYPFIDSLNLSDCQNLTEKGFLEALKNSKKILKITLKNNTWLTDEGLKYISKYCRNLFFIDISFCYLLTEEGIEAFLNKSTNLKTLKASDITIEELNFSKSLPLQDLNLLETNINDKTIYNILNSSPALYKFSFDAKNISSLGFLSLCNIEKAISFLKIKNAHSLSDKEFEATIPKETLKTLILEDANITDISLKLLINTPINVLHLINCNKITNQGLFFIKDIPFSILNFEGCSNISDEGLSYFLGKPNLFINISNCNISYEMFKKMENSGVKINSTNLIIE